MFSLMGNCLSSAKRRRKPKKSIILALLGVDNAGKTTASSSFSGDPIDLDAAPTIGFRNVKFSFDMYNITMYDIGGGKNIRPVWKNYFPEVYGFIFMVDSSSADRMDEARETFRECLEHPHVSGKPILLLANKQDKPEALDEVDICELLNLESVVNSNKCPCRIDACSAVQGTGRKMDRGMREGLNWLLTMIEKNWEELSGRIESDMKIVEEQRKVEAAAKRERVRRQREERERREEEERQRLGIEKKDSDEDDVINGDPFRPLDLEALKKKDEKLKAEKKKRKELEARLKEEEQQNEPVFTRVPLSPRPCDNPSQDDTTDIPGDCERVFSPRTLPSVLPPLQPLGTPFMEDSGQTKKKKKKTPRSSQPPPEPVKQSNDKTTDDDDDIVIATPRSQPVLTLSNTYVEKSPAAVSNIYVSTHDNFPSREMLAAGISRVLRPLDGGDAGGDADTPRTRRVKKKKLRQLGARQSKERSERGGDMKMTPRPQSGLSSLDGGDIELCENGAEQKKKKKVWKNGFGPTEEETAEVSARNVGSRGSDRALPFDRHMSSASRHSQMHSNVSLQSDHRGSKNWGNTGDITAVDDDAITFRQPNLGDDDDDIIR